ncbi:MAG: hypothetical protein OXI91_00455 [Chloroflexota bacterium]|nr:hypothetical protein [Chloroflexota bacterium]
MSWRWLLWPARALPVRLVSRDHRGPRAKPAWQARQAWQARRGPRGLLAPQAQQDRRDPSARLVQLVQLGP